MKRYLSFAIASTVALLALSSQIAPAQTASKSTGDPRVKAALEKLGLKYEVDEDGDFKVGMKFDDGRTQVAWITSQTEQLGKMEIREVSSAAYRSNGPISDKIANQLLADSAQKKLGAWQTFNNGKTYVAVFSAKIDASGSPEMLESSLRVVLYSADSMEKTLTNKDDF